MHRCYERNSVCMLRKLTHLRTDMMQPQVAHWRLQGCDKTTEMLPGGSATHTCKATGWCKRPTKD